MAESPRPLRDPQPVHPPRRAWRIHDLFSDLSEVSDQAGIDCDLLKSHARLIRDVLDPMIARDGPNALSPEQALELIKCLYQLQKALIPKADVRWSRIHYALHTISGRATRWPPKVVTLADSILERWAYLYGPLDQLRSPLYEEGGRLYGISRPEDLNRDLLLVKWIKSRHISPNQARRSGSLGFKPGDWWINSLYAYRDGIIDSHNAAGGISYDARAAYAILMTETDELLALDASRFTYRTRGTDAGRYRLTAATKAAREPVRVLRAHTLKSFWAPRAGVRYEGLYKIAGWSMVYNGTTRSWTYDVEFKRVETEEPMTNVLQRPIEEEMDDYKEYKRLRERAKAAEGASALPSSPKENENNRMAANSRRSTSSFVDTFDEDSLSVRGRSFATIPSDSETGETSTNDRNRLVRQRTVPMQAVYHEMLEAMRKASIDDVGGFAWER